jgi:hypothetical protein
MKKTRAMFSLMTITAVFDIFKEKFKDEFDFAEE